MYIGVVFFTFLLFGLFLFRLLGCLLLCSEKEGRTNILPSPSHFVLYFCTFVLLTTDGEYCTGNHPVIFHMMSTLDKMH